MQHTESLLVQFSDFSGGSHNKIYKVCSFNTYKSLSYEWKICLCYQLHIVTENFGFSYLFSSFKVGNVASEWLYMTLPSFWVCVDCYLVQNLLGRHTQTTSIIIYGVLLYYVNHFSFFFLVLVWVSISVPASQFPHIGICFIVCEEQICLDSANGFVLDPHCLQTQKQGNQNLERYINQSNKDVTVCIATMHQHCLTNYRL